MSNNLSVMPPLTGLKILLWLVFYKDVAPLALLK